MNFKLISFLTLMLLSISCSKARFIIIFENDLPKEFQNLNNEKSFNSNNKNVEKLNDFELIDVKHSDAIDNTIDYSDDYFKYLLKNNKDQKEILKIPNDDYDDKNKEIDENLSETNAKKIDLDYDNDSNEIFNSLGSNKNQIETTTNKIDKTPISRKFVDEEIFQTNRDSKENDIDNTISSKGIDPIKNADSNDKFQWFSFGPLLINTYFSPDTEEIREPIVFDPYPIRTPQLNENMNEIFNLDSIVAYHNRLNNNDIFNKHDSNTDSIKFDQNVEIKKNGDDDTSTVFDRNLDFYPNFDLNTIDKDNTILNYNHNLDYIDYDLHLFATPEQNFAFNLNTLPSINSNDEIGYIAKDSNLYLPEDDMEYNY